MWAAVTKGQLHKVLIDEFCFKEIGVSVVLLEYGPNQLRKTPEMRVSEFNHLWLEQLPECVLPSNDDERLLILAFDHNFWTIIYRKF